VTICLIIRLYVSFILIKQHIVADCKLLSQYPLLPVSISNTVFG
jgi:hypothetical protein